MKQNQKFIAILLIFSIISLSGNLFARERRGAIIVITNKDGQQIKGELIAVKESSLLLMERNSGADISVDVDNIRSIKIVKKSKVSLETGFGLLTREGLGVEKGGDVDPRYEWRNLFIYILGAFGIVAGALTGGFIRAVASMDKKIQLEGKSESEIREALDKLRSKAKVPDYN